MQIYLVGGAVRDEQLGRPVKDRDWVVVGATPQEMLDLGYKQVGADFPVFLHADSGEEYALARQERKVGPGYHGFETNYDPNVTLEDDLIRRDLTINAMAKDEHGNLIDPFGGIEDINAGVLRHTSEAFAEDPVRVLRVARFAARYGFEVHEETMALMQELVLSGELDHLTAERVWAELEKALFEDHPNKFFWTLSECNAIKVLFPELSSAMTYVSSALELAVLLEAPLVQRFIILLSVCDATEIIEVCDRLKVSNEIKKSVIKFEHFVRRLRKVIRSPREMVQLMRELDLFRRPDHMTLIGQTMRYFGDNINTLTFMKAFRAARRVSFTALTEEQQRTLNGTEISKAIDELRVEEIRKDLKTC